MSAPTAWGKNADLSKVKAPAPPRAKKMVILTERRHAEQLREFSTAAGGLQRSSSFSVRHEERTITVDPETNRAVSTSAWQHVGDTNRQHVHPGGGLHVPTAAAGMVAGAASTPAQRLALDGMASTVVASHITSPWR